MPPRPDPCGRRQLCISDNAIPRVHTTCTRDVCITPGHVTDKDEWWAPRSTHRDVALAKILHAERIRARCSHAFTRDASAVFLDKRRQDATGRCRRSSSIWTLPEREVVMNYSNGGCESREKERKRKRDAKHSRVIIILDDSRVREWNATGRRMEGEGFRTCRLEDASKWCSNPTSRLL